MRYLVYSLVFVSRIWLFPIYFLSGFVPRRKDVWVFGSWGGYRFADNAAAFFRYCHGRVDDAVTLVWISRRREIVNRLRNEGLRAHWIWSPQGMAACLRARLFLFDCFSKDINFWLSRGAEKVNLWSGVPLKTFERDIDNPHNRYNRLFHGPAPVRWLLAALMPWHVVRPDLIIATSEETAGITRRAFDIAEERVVVTGFPRNDVLFAPPGEAQRAAWPRELVDAVTAGRHVFLFLPTFRDSGRSPLDVDWERLEEQLAASGAMFFYKFHPMDQNRIDTRSAHIAKLPQDIDLYDILPSATALISDYSSIIFDYMLLERPIIYYVPDLDAFVAGERALNFDPLEIAVGPVCRDFEELSAALAATLEGQPDDAERRASAMARLHTNADGTSSARVLAAIDERFMGGRLAPAAERAIPAGTLA